MLTTVELKVRQAGPLDADVLAALHRDCFARAWDEAAMIKFAASPETLCLIGAVAAGASSVAGGLLIARKAGDEADILTFGVVPSYRNRGLGRALLGTATERLRASGTKRLFLEVEESNDAALRLYRSFGGEPVGRRQGYYDDGADAVIFSLAL
ncbi:MAG TPA: GNAT family N-acetyltransferase [Methyloceanibacter sp.]|jgi:[ribosomal protein S18]-alanine N-acetyltransferase|nr:GNAT family N-acetyltransferase [Methyloceanibacter sp.]